MVNVLIDFYGDSIVVTGVPSTTRKDKVVDLALEYLSDKACYIDEERNCRIYPCNYPLRRGNLMNFSYTSGRKFDEYLEKHQINIEDASNTIISWEKILKGGN